MLPSSQGLAHCYEKGDDGKVVDRFMIEPISANSLECMGTGAKTCFKFVYSMTLGDALARNKGAFPPEFADGTFCEEFETRCDSCARTWMRPHAMDNLL
jgi:phosphatidylinositol glycan class S